MSEFILHDRYFDPGAGRISSYFCRLFILVGQESLQYCILDTDKNSFIALADYRLPTLIKNPEIFHSKLRQLISGEESLLKKYPSVVIGLDTPWHTLVPSSLFDSKQIDSYLEFNFNMADGCLSGSDLLKETDAYNVYAYLPGLTKVFREFIADAAVVHRSSALVTSVHQHQMTGSLPTCGFLNFRGYFADLAFFVENRLVFFNSFPCHTKEDLLYFTLYTLEQLKLRPDSLPLFVSGMIGAGSEEYSLLEQYIGMVSFSGRMGAFDYSPILKQLPSHYYQELFALALCGS